jgi:hypothetical protein
MHRDQVYRDPETGQFVAVDDDEPVELNYSDFEILNFRINVDFGGDADADNGTEYQVESDVLDLENDELAMLSWINASLSVIPRGFPESAGDVTRGAAQANVEIGANLAGSEYLAQASQNRGVEVVDDEPVVNSFALQANDEQGIWAHLNAAAVSGYKDSDADGTFSGQGMADNDRMRRVYNEETSGGPYIDATDDVSIGIFVRKSDFAGVLRTLVYGQMALLVFEYENRRAEFAPYDPGSPM